MKEYTFENDVNVFGVNVTTFPSGISDAFNELIKETGDCAGARDYYGISEFKDGRMVYYAVAAEKFKGESEKYNYEKLSIEKGKYASVTVFDWRKKTDCIKDVFGEILQHPQVDKTKPAIEWYRNDNEMICLVKMKESQLQPNL